MKGKRLKIVFEGPNCSGKSTLVEQCRKRWPDIEFADRSFISDRVYAVIFNRKKYLGVDIKIYLSFWEQTHANTLDTRIVLCIANTSDLVKRAYEKKEPFTKDKTEQEVFNYLDEEYFEFCFYTRRVAEKYKLPKLEQCMNEIAEFIK